MNANHWSEDSGDDFAWRNYSAGWDIGYAAAKAGNHSTDLTGHGEPYCEGFSDGWESAQHR